MTEPNTDPRALVEAARKAFEQEFERFARFEDESALGSLKLDEAEAERRSLADLRTRHLGKKSVFAASKNIS